MSNCNLCALATGIVAVNDHWTLALNENQATIGRVFFALRRHETDVTAITAAERESLWEFAGQVKRALSDLFAPDHFNYMFHMNIDPHVHMHIYPRYRSAGEFAGVKFVDSRFGDHYDPREVRKIDDPVRDALAAAIRDRLTGAPA